MSLRVRIVVVVVVVVTAAVAVVGAIVRQSTETSLIAEIDADLLQRTEAVTVPGPGAPVIPDLRDPTSFRAGRRADAFAALVGFDAMARVVDDEGEVRGSFDVSFEAPTGPEILAAADRGPVLSYGDGTDGRVRVVTVALPRAGYVQLGRPLGEVDRVLADLRRMVFVVAALAIVGSAAAAWVLAGRTVAPIRRLTAATEEVSRTGDVELTVDVGGGDTEVARLTSSFRSMLAALATSRTQQRQLVMDSSHELRTPLTSLRTDLAVLRRSIDSLSAEDRAALIADAEAEAAELTDLVAELVELATDVRAEEEIVPGRLEDVAEAVVDRSRRRTGRIIELRVVRSAEVAMRPEAVARAVRNLVDNAVKFSPADTAVVVEVDGAMVTVLDDGPGIPTDERELIFERFHRLPTSRTLPGSGLGLAIVAQVVDAHDGETFVADHPDHSTAIGFRLPQ